MVGQAGDVFEQLHSTRQEPKVCENQPLVMSQNCKMQGCQWYGVKLFVITSKSSFHEYEELWKKIWGISLF